MPELPEVETIVRELAPSVVGRTIAGVEVSWERTIAGLTAKEMIRALVGQRIERIARRAKLIVLDLSGGSRLVIHLAMTGRLLLRPSGSPEDRFTRIAFSLDNGQEIRYADARKFGRIRLLSPQEYAKIEERLGPEPLSPDFTPDRFQDAIRRTSARIKPLLLDQRFVAGVGNIYADEALFEAGIHPVRPARSLSDEEIERLYHAIRHVLAAGIRDRGTTFESYLDAFGRPGEHQFKLSVYRRTGKPCPRCSTPIERRVIAGRSAHFCPRCQPAISPA